MEDCRSQVAGGIRTGLLLWDSCILPFLLNNAGTWFNMKKSDLKRLTKLQDLFLNNLLNTFNCPVPLMYFDLCVTQIDLQILRQKLLLYHHISCLPENAFAHNILTICQTLNLPGIHVDVSPFLTEHEIIDVRAFSKKEWKTLITKLISSANRKSLIENSKRYKKLNHVSLSLEEYKLKDYFDNLDLARGRVKFKERSFSMTSCKRHFLNEFVKSTYYCSGCNTESVDVLRHWGRCSGYSKFAQSRNLENESELLAFYIDVINFRRDQL